jgi:tetratricopeptide (TPR) repeat protein
VADDDRLKERDLSELRKKLVASAATFYQKFIAARKGDPRLEFMLGRAYYNLGRLHSDLAESAEAIDKLGQAQAVFGRLSESDPNNPEYRYYAGLAGLDLAIVYRWDQKRLDEAEKVLDKALPLLEQLARQHPAVKKYRSKESLGVMERSQLLNTRGHADRAEPVCRRAVDLQRQVVKDFPETEERHYLSRYLGNLGSLLDRLNRQKDGNQCLEEAIRINKEVVQAAPRVGRYRVTTSWIYQELFWNLRDLGDVKASDQAIGKAVEVDRQLVAEFPSVPSYQSSLVFNLQYIVERLTNTGKTTQAVPVGQEAIRLGEKLVADYPKEPTFRRDLAAVYYSQARALHRGGQVIEGEKLRRRSIELYEGLCKESPELPMYWENLATSRAGLLFVLLSTGRLPEAKEEGFRALAVFEKLAREHPSVAEYPFRFAETSFNVARTLAFLGEPNDVVLQKGIAAVEPLLKKGRNARYEEILAALKAQPVFSAPHPPAKVQPLTSDVASVPAAIKGELTGDDPLDLTFPPTQKSHHKVHLVRMTAGKHYQIDLTADFDTFLRLEDQMQTRLLFNDDVCSPENVNSRLIFSPKKTATYRVIVTSFKPGITGPYTLKVREAVLEGPGQAIEGKLTEQDENVKGRYGKRQKVELQAGLAHVIEVQSPDYDIRMNLGDAAGKQALAKGILINTNKKQISRVDFTPGQTGPYVLFLTTAKPGQTGAYTVHIQAYKLAAP